MVEETILCDQCGVERPRGRIDWDPWSRIQAEDGGTLSVHSTAQNVMDRRRLDFCSSTCLTKWFYG